MLGSALMFLVLVVLVTLLGAAAPWEQGVPEIVFGLARSRSPSPPACYLA